MDKIRNKLAIKDTILPTPYWDVTKSGKVLELRVKPSIDQQPDKYRLGVIQIGRIISRIQTLANQSGTQPQIQLFPNLSENRLAATVFWPGFLEGLRKTEPEAIHRTTLSDIDIQTIAKHYDFTIAADQSLASDDESRSAYFVMSKSNQPFIWLKLGQFIQDLTEQVVSVSSNSYLTIEVLTTGLPVRSESDRKKAFKQSKIYVTRNGNNSD